MKSLTKAGVVLTALLLASILPACSKAPPEYTSVKITQSYPGTTNPPRTKTITDPATIAQLAGFFPTLGTKKHSGRTEIIQAKLKAEFVRVNGKTVTVLSNFDDWSESNGDWDVNGDLKQFVEDQFTGSK